MSAVPIVVDLGSGYIKAGSSHAAEPSGVFPALVGKPRRRFVEQYRGYPVFCGEEAVECRDKLSLFSPIDHGHIKDWNSMDEIWTHVFSGKFGLTGDQAPILITQPPKASRTHQQKILETLFEMFGAPEVSIQVQGVLGLYSVAMTTGLTTEIGEGVTQVVPVMEGQIINEGVTRIDCGGQELTMYLQKLLCNNGFAFTTRDDFEYCRLIKETYCYVPLDPAAEDLRTDLNVQFSLPDGFKLRDGTSQINLGPERFYCAEALFNPALIEKDHPPLFDIVMGSIAKCPIDLRTSMLQNIILSGGSSLFDGLDTRLHDTLTRIVPKAKQHLVKIRKPESGVYAVWQGGKIYCEMKDVHGESWIPLHEYQDSGDSVLERYR
ncbi:actin [Gregarina niphandrodes]|uniref:Actin n=1 Tax=Gregarina niphandrodes TaxID=110365 RepID=A0A023B4F3_GRENI|nr:actin [Gregarina niphandrodes]EZG56712.1 actin [Gregarina niphandrodes]|eukprot:XP_011131180.1 actin [Gregarina niphandrodes]